MGRHGSICAAMLAFGAAAAFSAASCAPWRKGAYPAKPIRVIIPMSVGAGIDVILRKARRSAAAHGSAHRRGEPCRRRHGDRPKPAPGHAGRLHLVQLSPDPCRWRRTSSQAALRPSATCGGVNMYFLLEDCS